MAMKALPSGAAPYSRTAEMTEAGIPDGLTSQHTTKPGTWGRITILEGTLNYHIDGDAEVHVLSPETPGIVEPERPHRVEAIGPVRFFVEFLR